MERYWRQTVKELEDPCLRLDMGDAVFKAQELKYQEETSLSPDKKIGYILLLASPPVPLKQVLI